MLDGFALVETAGHRKPTTNTKLARTSVQLRSAPGFPPCDPVDPVVYAFLDRFIGVSLGGASVRRTAHWFPRPPVPRWRAARKIPS